MSAAGLCHSDLSVINGTRLWPLSRQTTPKHLLPLASGGDTLLRSTPERVIGLGESIRVVTAAGQVAGCHDALARLGLPAGSAIEAPSAGGPGPPPARAARPAPGAEPC